MYTLSVELYCPPMKVTMKDWRTFVTAQEPMTLSISSAEGFHFSLSPVTIPPTMVNRKSLAHWLVERCQGQGSDAEGNAFLVSLPPELVLFDIMQMSMIATEMTAPCTLKLADGRYFCGEVVFPDCPTNLLTGVAQAVTAKGTMSLELDYFHLNEAGKALLDSMPESQSARRPDDC